MRSSISKAKRWVIKIGSAMVTNEGRGLREDDIAVWAQQIVALRRHGIEVVLVSSGAVAEGIKRLGWGERPHELHKLQAAAAVGQMGLVQAYEACFKGHGIHTAQILLTHEDLSNRQRYLNSRSALRTLLEMGVVPVINENDTVATDEIRFGDNDTLAALVANLVEADLLVILTDQQGLYSADPRNNPDAVLLHEVRSSDPALSAMAGKEGGSLGRGGMYTKVKAAERAARSGCATVIAYGRAEKVLERIQSQEQIGTLFIPDLERLDARKQWLAGQLKVKGTLVLDDGAVARLKQSGSSLLPVGVIDVQGRFDRGEVVKCLSQNGEEVACGIVNYNSQEAAAIKRLPTARIEEALGYIDEAELIHRDNLVLL